MGVLRVAAVAGCRGECLCLRGMAMRCVGFNGVVMRGSVEIGWRAVQGRMGRVPLDQSRLTISTLLHRLLQDTCERRAL